MGKKSKGSTYISKGERRNVSRKQINAGRTERKANPSVKSMIAASNHRQNIIDRSKDKSVADLREKYMEESSIERQAEDLYKKYSAKGATWAACVQAVKTDWVSNFINKYQG